MVHRVPKGRAEKADFRPCIITPQKWPPSEPRVQLLLDENLSPRLVNRLNQLLPGLTHVREVGLQEADDQQIWDWARDNAFAIITTDADFVALAQRRSWPPKIVQNETVGLLSLRLMPGQRVARRALRGNFDVVDRSLWRGNLFADLRHG